MILNLVLAMTLASAPQVDSLQVQLIGNAGVRLSDGQTTVLIDLPYVSGSFGYQTWDSAGLVLVGPVVAAFTHAHDDHFDPRGLRRGWLVMGGDAVIAGTGDGFETTQADVTVGEFSVTALPTPHSPGHRSYRVEWRGRSLYFTGDTEDAAVLGHQEALMFSSPRPGTAAKWRRPAWRCQALTFAPIIWRRTVRIASAAERWRWLRGVRWCCIRPRADAQGVGGASSAPSASRSARSWVQARQTI